MAKPQRQTHQIDATDQAPGRLATEVAKLLRGKHKPTFEPHIDAGDVVQVANVAQMKFTGRKLDQKTYYHHTGYPGGLRETAMAEVFAKDPGEVLRRAVYNMLPKNKLRSGMMKRLIIK